MATLTCYKGALNPARALGPAFVVNQFSFHWSDFNISYSLSPEDEFDMFHPQGVLGGAYPGRGLWRLLLPVHLQCAAAKGQHQGHGGQHEHGEQQRGRHD